MKQILSRGKQRILKQGLSLIAVFAALTVTLVAFLPNLTFGWFSQNNNVSANGMSVMADMTEFELYYRMTESEAWTLINLTDPIPVADTIKAPGDSVSFQIRVLNKGDSPVDLTAFGLAAPVDATEESPRVIGSYSYYLSTEIYTSLRAVSVAGVTVTSSDVYLRTGDVAGSVDYFDQMSEETVRLASEGDVIFTLSLSFINRADDQNMFKNFDTYGKCQRRFFLTFENVNSGA